MQISFEEINRDYEGAFIGYDVAREAKKEYQLKVKELTIRLFYTKEFYSKEEIKYNLEKSRLILNRIKYIFNI